MLKKTFLAISIAFLTSCGSTNPVVTYKTTQPKNNLTSIKSESSNPKLTIKSTPGATIKIMNIIPKYKDGIELKPGRYDIQITKDGYYKYRSWIQIDKDTVINKPLEIEKDHIEAIKLPKVKKNYFNYVTEFSWNSRNEPYSLQYDSKTKLVWAVQDALLENAQNNNFKPFSEDELYIGRSNSVHFDTVYEGLHYAKIKKELYLIPKGYYSNSLPFNDLYKIGNVNSLQLNTQKLKWDFPSRNEFVKSKKLFKDLTAFYSYNHGMHRRSPQDSIAIKIRPYRNSGGYFDVGAVYLSSVCTSNRELTGGHRRCAKADNSVYGSKLLQLDSESDHSFPLFLVRKPETKYEKIIFNALPIDEKLELMVSILTEERLKVVKPVISKPQKEKYIVEKKLKKGEFETSSDYELRLEKEKIRISEKNKAIDEAYSIAQLQYNQLVNHSLAQYSELVRKNKQESVIRDVANQSAKRAINMLFGDPKFKNVKYDADNEQFTADLYSVLNSFSMKVTIPIPINEAKEFKKRINNRLFVPSVQFNVVLGKLKFSNVSVVGNEFRQSKDFDIAKSKDTKFAYYEFIDTHPKSSLSKKAQQRIDEIHEAEHIARIKAEKEAKIRAQRAAEARAKEQQAYMKEKFVGNKVCMSGSMAFGFINPTIKGFVESKNGNNIQIRIVDTDGTSPYYNGVELRANLLIWDSYSSWKHCN